jgi:lysozyme family protein
MVPITRQSGPTTLRQMLLAAGVGQFTAVMSIPYMMFLPSTTDPYAQGVIQLAQGLQRLLKKRGAPIRVTGMLDAETVSALQYYAGPRWYEQSWAQLYAAVLDGRSWKGYRRLDRTASARPLPMPTKTSQAEEDAIASEAALSGYLREQLGDDAASASYCTPGNVPPGCTPVAGVSKPMDQITLTTYQQIQRATNALRAKRGLPLIDVDGRLGPQTLSAIGTVYTSGQIPLDLETAAANAMALAAQLMTQVLVERANYVPDPSPSSPPTVLVAGAVQNPPDDQVAAAAGGFFSTPLGLAALAVGGVVVWSLWKKTPKQLRGAKRALGGR